MSESCRAKKQGDAPEHLHSMLCQGQPWVTWADLPSPVLGILCQEDSWNAPHSCPHTCLWIHPSTLGLQKTVAKQKLFARGLSFPDRDPSGKGLPELKDRALSNGSFFPLASSAWFLTQEHEVCPRDQFKQC